MQFRWKKKFSLTTKFIVLTSSVIFATSLIIVFFIVVREMRHIKKELLDYGRSVVTMLAQNSEYGIYTEDKKTLQQIINSIGRNPDIVYVAILGKTKGMLLQRVYDPLIQVPLAPRGGGSERDGQISYQEFSDNQSGYDFFDILAPVVSVVPSGADGNMLYEDRAALPSVIGYVQLGLSQKKLDERIRQFIYPTIGFTLLLVALGIGLTVVLTRRITSPIKRLSKVTRDISEGEFDHHIEITTNDEISDLSEAFNSMLGHLRAYRNKVVENTSELYDANLQMHEEIRERKDTERELLEAKKRLEQLLSSVRAEKEFSDAIFNSAVSGIMVADREGTVLKINRAGADILQVSGSGLIGRKITSVFPQAAPMLLLSPELGREISISLMNGTMVPVGFNNSSLLDPVTGQEGIIILFRNMTEIRKLQLDLRKKEYFETIGKVVASVAQEITNPLFAVMSMSQMLRKEVASPEHQSLVQSVIRESDKIKRLIEELLLYTRPAHLYLEDISLGDVFGEIQRYVQEMRSAIRVTVDIPPVLTIRADRDKMVQVFYNLMNNALDAARSQITVTAAAVDDTVEVKISDDGQGISGRDLEMVFDPFFTTKRGGTGLGLSICKKIIEDHGGTIRIASSEGRGASVILTFRK